MSMDTHDDWLADDLPAVEDVGAPEAQVVAVPGTAAVEEQALREVESVLEATGP